MKIAIVPSADLSYNSGSIIYAKNLFEFLHSHGHEAYLLGSKPPDDVSDELMRYIKIVPFLLEHPIIDDREVSSVDYAQSLSAIVNYLVELHEIVGLDLIHAHYGSFNSFGAYVAFGLTEVPYIVSSFGRDVNLGYEHDRRIKWLIDGSFSNASRILVTDETIKNKICSMYSSECIGQNILEIPMPLDERIFLDSKDSKLHIDEKTPILATVNSCFSPEKGIVTILTAFAEIVKKIPCCLVIAGQDDHPEQIHRKLLDETVKRLGIGNAVIFTGYLDRASVGQLLRTATLLIDARQKGNFSSVLLEAMFIGTPVVATRNDASLKIIKHEYNGLLFKQEHSRELESKVIECLFNPSILTGLKAGMAQWLDAQGEIYREENCFTKILSVYKEIAGGGSVDSIRNA
ncbi:glycosyltransferase family 4 protein [Paenibacillus durus]|uniref:glycosyltransferase family 4 protein n=1 Tax=Paenibacillus durus TaxID=44251 RepID=UPI0009DFF042|nr:glycosyltransferase family 4 protein [Paenibacillus durus]